jgi:hypothetical protein
LVDEEWEGVEGIGKGFKPELDGDAEKRVLRW